jgi:hypothetical protein
MSINQQTGNKINIEKTGFFSGALKNMMLKKKTLVVVNQLNTEENEIIECLDMAKKDWTNACLDFEYANDQDLIDYHTYRIKAYQLRYEYFLKMAKEKGLKANAIEENIVIPVSLANK